MAPRDDLLTRYFIYEDVPDNPDEPTPSGALLQLVGEELAKSSQDALRAHFAKPPDREGVFVAISENARRLRTVKTTVKATISEVKDEPRQGGYMKTPEPDRLSDPTVAV